MKKYLIVCGIIIMLFCIKSNFPVCASTSSELESFRQDYVNYDKYSNNYSAPFSKDSQNGLSVNEYTGSLNLKETDLSISGKNGLDVNITRIYGSYNSGYDYSKYSSD